MKLEQAFIKSFNEMTFLWIVLFGLNNYVLANTDNLKKVIILSSVYVGGLTLINYMKEDDDHNKKALYDYHYH
jgi:hypothetical protein